MDRGPSQALLTCAKAAAAPVLPAAKARAAALAIATPWPAAKALAAAVAKAAPLPAAETENQHYEGNLSTGT